MNKPQTMSNSFSSLDRSSITNKLKDQHFDLLIIGGGVTGSGIALDAASRGLSVALVEKRDFASGTSSKSTKLIHGGLRYLKQLDIALVRETGQERAVLNKLAPHLALPEKMLLPIVEEGTFGKFTSSIGLWVYDFLADVKGKDKRKMLSKQEALKKEPLLNENILKGAGYYAEYRTDDARLTIELIKKAIGYGATALNYTEVVDFIEHEKIEGVVVKDQWTSETYNIKAKKVVSAAGPWVDELRRMNDSFKGKRLHLTKGVHLVVPHEKLPLNQSVYFDVPDGRMIFAIPRGKVTYIGTTDTNYTASLDRVVALKSDRDYLLEAVNNAFPDIHLSANDVVSNWAGLRPLIHEDGKSPSEISRKDEIFEADNGLLSIAGGKLTGYRKMAEKIVDLVCERFKEQEHRIFPSVSTQSIALTKEPFKNNGEVTSFINQLKESYNADALSHFQAWYLTTNYGKVAAEIIDQAKGSGQLNDESIVLAELDYTMKNELVSSAEDFFVRRTGKLYFDIDNVKEFKDLVISTMAGLLGWSQQRIKIEKEHIDLLLQDATTYYDEEFA